MKTGKRFLRKIQGWTSSSHEECHQPTATSPTPQNSATSSTRLPTVTTSSRQSSSITAPEMKEEVLNNDTPSGKQLPTWQIRKRNKARMPRPKSTGYLKDFNILSAEDDIEDDSNRAYDDFVLRRDDTDFRREYTGQQKESHKKDFGQSNRTFTATNYTTDKRNECESIPNGNIGDSGCQSMTKDPIRGRDGFVLTKDVSHRAAYWQRREDESNKEPDTSTSSGVLRNWKTPGQIRQLKDEVDPQEMTQYIYDKGVANRAAMWQKLEDDHFEKMMINPDKEWKGPAIRVVLDKSHPDYGRPPKGSKTEKRGIKAHKHVVKEIGELCLIIAENGDQKEDGTVTITFRKLFHTYVPISNKVVGILIRARKRGLLHFNGEMLYQRQDEDEIIRLFAVPEAVE